MKKTYPILLGFTILCSFITKAQTQPSWLKVTGRFLQDNCGNNIVLRGVNHGNTWATNWGIDELPEIAQSKSNCVRLCFETTYYDWNTNTTKPTTSAEMEPVIVACLAQKMIPIVELHDWTTAAGNPDVTLPLAVNFWTSTDIKNLLLKYQHWLILNIANEPEHWNGFTEAQYLTANNIAVTAIRNAGLSLPIMIDGMHWGQDEQFFLNNGTALLANDPLHKLLFSVHAYWVTASGYTDAVVQAKMLAIKNANLPILFGEFSQNGGTPTQTINYPLIMQLCQQYNIGSLCWWWGFINPGSNNLESMTPTGLYGGLTGYGKIVALTDPNSIFNTAQKTVLLTSGACAAVAPVTNFNKYIAQPYGNDNTVRFFEKNNVTPATPTNILNVGNFVNGVVIDGSRMFVASDNVHYYDNPLPINKTKNAVNLGTVINTGFIIGMAIEPITHNLFVTRNNNQITYYTASNNYATAIDITVPACCVPIIIANIAFDNMGNLWATAFDGSTSGGAAAIWCFTKSSNFQSSFIIGEGIAGNSNVAQAVNSYDGLSHNNLYLFSQPEGVAIDATGNVWVANNNDDNGPDNTSGTLVKITKTWLDNNIYNQPNPAPSSPTIINNISSSDAPIYYIGGAKFGGLAFDGDTLYINDQGQNQGNNLLTSGKVWKWNTTQQFRTTIAPSGVPTTYPGNGTMALTNTAFIPINIAIDGDAKTNTIVAPTDYDIYNSTYTRMICKTTPSGTAPLVGNVYAKTFIETSVQGTNSANTFVQRHYEIIPTNTPASATATIKLYFLNSEFQAYNTSVGAIALHLPDANISTTTNISNVHISQFHGTSTTHLPGSYTGTSQDITPTSVVWNAYLEAWEVTFDVTGFSGFFAKAGTGILALNQTNLVGIQKTGYNLLNWQTINDLNINKFEMEYCTDNFSFHKIGTIDALNTGTNNYQFIHSTTEKLAYYRLKITTTDNKDYYTNTIKIANNQTLVIGSSTSPNPTKGTCTIALGDKKLLNTTAFLFDINGRVIQQILLKNYLQPIDLGKNFSGTYLLKLSNGEVLKIVKE